MFVGTITKKKNTFYTKGIKIHFMTNILTFYVMKYSDVDVDDISLHRDASST